MFDTSNGWEYRQASVDGRDVLYPIAFQPTPHNVFYIWFAPNHVRAFSRHAYEKAGGYDPARNVLDDHDLMCRLYEVGDFHLIEDCLYLERMHSGNTQRERATNAFIQTETVALYAQYIERNALAWANVGFYNENSFWYFTEAKYQSYVPEIEARFQVSRLVTSYPSEWHSAHNISYVSANLIALKPSAPRNGGPIFW
jgi:hypothetical protein